jgi:hypothetical protein
MVLNTFALPKESGRRLARAVLEGMDAIKPDAVPYHPRRA